MGWSQDGGVSRTVGISSQKHIFLKIQQIQLSLKERPEDTGQQPDYIHTCENPVPGERGKIQATAWQDPRPLTPVPSGRRGVGAGREREPRTAKHPALAIRTRVQIQCMHGVLETREIGQQDL